MVISLASLVLLSAGCSKAPNDSAFDAAERIQTNPAHEWRHYLGDAEHSHFSPLKQINTANVGDLREAWRYQAGGAPKNGLTQLQCNPLIINGILYGVSPDLNAFALNAATGEELRKYESAADADSVGINPLRGVAYWQSGDDQRILYTANSELIALNARTGVPIKRFGKQGIASLHAGLPQWAKHQTVIATTPGTVYKDLYIIGSRVSEFVGSPPGHIRAFNIRTGELAWAFHTIPQAGEFGAETWPEGALSSAGGANSWAGIAVDHKRGIAFLPTGSPTFDFYGGDRAGDNLFGNSLIALNANTGERLWHYQFIRHDLWDRDLPSPPNLITVERDGRSIDAVAQATKSGHIFVFDRETGEPLFPMVEIPVTGEAVDGEVPAISQPLPTSPPPFATQSFVASTRTPEVATFVAQYVAKLDPHATFRPPSTNGTILYPGIDGGAEWGGMAWDAELNYLFVNSNEVPYVLAITEIPPDQEPGIEMAYLMMCGGCHGADRRGDGVSVPSLVNVGERLNPWQVHKIVAEGRGRMPGFKSNPLLHRLAAISHLYLAKDDPNSVAETQQGEVKVGGPRSYLNAGYQKLIDQDNMPASEPPWGTLTAIDLADESIAWRIPFGDYPAMLEKGIKGLGSENYGGPVITDGGLLFIAATPDKKLKAHDKRTGELLWSAELPASGYATPSVYSVDGKQYLVIAAGGGKFGEPSASYYVAYSLP